MKKLLFVCLFLVTACVSSEELAAARYNYERIVNNQCQNILGFYEGTQNYSSCQSFYRNYLNSMGYYSNNLRLSQVQGIQNTVKYLNNTCANIFGSMSKQQLWNCVSSYGNKEIELANYKRALAEYEQAQADYEREQNERMQKREQKRKEMKQEKENAQIREKILQTKNGK